MWERVGDVLRQAFGRLGAVLAADLPGFVAMLVVILVAVIAAFAVRAALRFSLARVGFDRRAREWGLTTGRGIEPHRDPSSLVARGAFWIVIASGIALALSVLGASATSLVGFSFLSFVSRLVVGAIIVLAGTAVGRFLERSVLIGAVNQGIRQARVVAWGVKWVVLVLAAAMALQHVGIGGSLPTIAFTIVVGGIVLASSLAFGLGARNAISRALERQAEGDEEKRERDQDRIHHL